MAISREDADGNLTAQPTSPQFGVQDVVCDAHHTLILSGELDLAMAPGLEATITRLCRKGVKGISLDLSGLTFMDSSGLQAVFHAQRLCREHGYDFLVAPGNGQVLRFFEIAGVIDALPIADRDAL
ncbi:MAG: STAS domain-containing protein [Solirubrobacteraceae bacterium]